MKKCLFAFSLMLFVASLGLAFTSEYQSGSSAQKAMKTVSGEVMSVDSTKNEVVLKDEAGGEVRFLVNKSTKVTKEGKPATLAEVKPSEKVTCECEESTNGLMAKSLRVGPVKTD